MTAAPNFAPSSFGIEQANEIDPAVGSYKPERARIFEANIAFGNLQGTKPSSSDAMIFYPTKDLVGEKVVSARVPACELYYGGWIAFVASITLTIVDSAAQRNLISGTLIVLLMVSAVGLWVTAWVAQKDTASGPR